MRSTVAGKMAEERNDIVAIDFARPREAIPVGRRLESAAGQSQAPGGSPGTEQGDECQLLVTHDASSEGGWGVSSGLLALVAWASASASA